MVQGVELYCIVAPTVKDAARVPRGATAAPVRRAPAGSRKEKPGAFAPAEAARGICNMMLDTRSMMI
jgi:hypothetical protein